MNERPFLHLQPMSKIEEKKSWSDSITPTFIKEWRAIWKAEGFKALLKQKGWKVGFAIFMYYLIRDSILYILIPYLIYNGVINL